jgi:hypothetical protein
LNATWTNTVTVTWDAVLPIDATHIAFPQLDSTTQQAIPPPGASPIAVDFAAIDSSDLTDFDALEAAGIFANGSIVPTPMTGEIRTTHATSSL